MSFNRSGYIGRAPGDSAITLAKQYFQPTGVTTDFTFSSGYSPGLVDVYRNGIKLINVLDYAATDGSTISLSTPVGVGSTVQVVAYKAFNLATVKATELDTSVTGTDLTLAGDLTVSSLATVVDINVSGGATVSGTLVANSFSGDGTGLTGVASTDNIITGTAATFRNTAVSAGVPNLNVVGLATVGILTAYGTLSGTVAEFSAESTFSDVLNIGGIVNANSTTDSTSSSTGALIVDGGLGVAKNVYIGAGLSVAGTLTYEDVTNVDSVGVVTAKSGVNITGGQLTVGSGITMGIAGVATFSGTSDVHLLDNVRLNVGDGSDLAIYHNGTNSKISNATGTLYIEGTTEIWNSAGSEAIAKFTTDGSVELYEDNTKRLETTTTGVSIAGTTISSGGDFITYDNGHVKLGQNSDLDLFHNGTDSFIRSAVNNLNINAGNSAQNVYINLNENVAGVTSERAASFNKNGSVDLYYDNSKKFETTTSGVTVTGTVAATNFTGDGSNLTGISAGISTSISTAAGIVSTLALADAQDHKVTVSGITTFTCNGGTEGDSHTLRLVNSGVTTVGFSTYFLFPSGSAPSIPTADGTVSLISFTVHRQGSAGIATQLLAGASLNFS